MVQLCLLRLSLTASQQYTAASRFCSVEHDREELFTSVFFKPKWHPAVKLLQYFWLLALCSEQFFFLYCTVVFQHSLQHAVVNCDEIPLRPQVISAQMFQPNLVTFCFFPCVVLLTTLTVANRHQAHQLHVLPQNFPQRFLTQYFENACILESRLSLTRCLHYDDSF